MASPATPPASLLRHRDSLEAALRAAIGAGAGDLPAAARYVLGWQDEAGRPAKATGKRLRPLLCLFTAEAFGGAARDAMPGAVAVELVHNFSLVHDEVQDHDATRHGRPTLWARLGEGQAINAGDYLYSRATAALIRGDGPVERRMAALSVLNDAIERMIEGQWRDISFESRASVTVDEYLEMSAGKTGALLGAPVEIGALLAGATARAAGIIGRWGVEVGLAFQAQDDYLGIWGDPDATGKSNTNDIARRKKTLPIIHGMANPDAGALIRRTYAMPGELGLSQIEAAIRALEDSGAGQLCRDQARRHADAADDLLESLTLPPETRAAFRAVANFLVDRDF